ncbi:MAG: hypothetical protein IIC09_08135, partial [Proteobacteria bacterium]|nr:hypothetical protein [Pseudomonadota bacterium]
MSIKDCIKFKKDLDPADLENFETQFKELTGAGVPSNDAYTQAAELVMEDILGERNELASEVIGEKGYLEVLTIEELLNPASYNVATEPEVEAPLETPAEEVDSYDATKEKGVTLGVSESDVNPTGAFHATSFSPEKRETSWSRDYVTSMVNAWEEVEGKINDDNRDRVTEQFERLKEGYAKRLNEYFSSQSRVMSSMITGPANFPLARNQKRMDAADKKLNDAFAWLKKGTNRLNKSVLAPVDATQKVQLAEAQAKLKQREDQQVRMKAINAAHKKFLKDPGSLDKTDLTDEDKDWVRRYEPKYSWEPHPLAPYQVTNNNAEIRRLKLRVKMLEGKAEKAESAQPGDNSYQFEGGTVELNYEDDRLRILFDEKPDADMRQQLKSHGFRWSPKAGAWQRKITPAAVYDAGNILGTDFKGMSPDPAAKLRDKVEGGSTVLQVKNWLKRPLKRIANRIDLNIISKPTPELLAQGAREDDKGG